jgi:hypothetical protein
MPLKKNNFRIHFLLIIFVLKLYIFLVNLFIQLQTEEIFKYIFKILTHSKIIITMIHIWLRTKIVVYQIICSGKSLTKYFYE